MKGSGWDLQSHKMFKEILGFWLSSGKGAQPNQTYTPWKLLTWNLKMNWWFGSMLQPDSKQGSFNNKVAVPTPKCCAKVADSPPGWVSRSFALDEWHQWHSYMQDWPQPLNSWGMEGLCAMLGWWRPVKCWGGAVGIVFVEQFWLKSVFFKSFLWWIVLLVRLAKGCNKNIQFHRTYEYNNKLFRE